MTIVTTESFGYWSPVTNETSSSSESNQDPGLLTIPSASSTPSGRLSPSDTPWAAQISNPVLPSPIGPPKFTEPEQLAREFLEVAFPHLSESFIKRISAVVGRFFKSESHVLQQIRTLAKQNRIATVCVFATRIIDNKVLFSVGSAKLLKAMEFNHEQFVCEILLQAGIDTVEPFRYGFNAAGDELWVSFDKHELVEIVTSFAQNNTITTTVVSTDGLASVVTNLKIKKPESAPLEDLEFFCNYVEHHLEQSNSGRSN